jgi:hypothetical protein
MACRSNGKYFGPLRRRNNEVSELRAGPLLFQLLWQPRTEQIMLVILTKIANVLCH